MQNQLDFFLKALDTFLALDDNLPVEQVAEIALEWIIRTTGAQGGSLLAFEPGRPLPVFSVMKNFPLTEGELKNHLLRSVSNPLSNIKGFNAIAVPIEARQKMLGLAFLTKSNFTEIDLKYARHLGFYAAVCFERARARAKKQNHQIIRFLVRAVGARDRYTGIHSLRVTRYTLGIAAKMGLTRTFRERLRTAALLHDIGKISISDNILFKKGPLTADEFALIKTHPVTGAKILGSHGGFQEITPFVLHHHERWDGKGYPHGLAGEEIPLGARIICVADAFEAMTADRPYRPARGRKQAVAELVRHAGTQFDPRVVRVFVKCLEES